MGGTRNTGWNSFHGLMPLQFFSTQKEGRKRNGDEERRKGRKKVSAEMLRYLSLGPKCTFKC